MTLRALWCEWTHGGGRIERDDQGRINWRCAKCGRWHDDVKWNIRIRGKE